MNPEHGTAQPLVPAKSTAAAAAGSTSPSIGDAPVRSPEKPGAVIRAIRLPLGLTVLLAERLKADLGVRDGPALGVAGAYTVGLADAALSVTGRVARSVADVAERPARAAIDAAQAILRRPMVARTTGPARGLTSAIAGRAANTAARGRAVASEARADAVVFLNLEWANGLTWVRGEVLPTVIDDLVADPKVRDLVVEQTQGALTDVAREVRRRSARADTRLEAGVRRIFTRERHELAP